MPQLHPQLRHLLRTVLTAQEELTHPPTLARGLTDRPTRGLQFTGPLFTVNATGRRGVVKVQGAMGVKLPPSVGFNGTSDSSRSKEILLTERFIL